LHKNILAKFHRGGVSRSSQRRLFLLYGFFAGFFAASKSKRVFTSVATLPGTKWQFSAGGRAHGSGKQTAGRLMCESEARFKLWAGRTTKRSKDGVQDFSMSD